MNRRVLSPIRKPFWISFLTSVLVISLLGSYGFTSIGASAAPTQVKSGGTVVIDNVSGSLWTCNFNPFSPSYNGLSAGIFYEPLYYINQLTGASKPWLATSYAWSNGNKTLTFTMRKGVKWSDGKPLTAADVAFTFNLEKKFSGLDLQAVWSVLSSVKAQGSKVVFTFKQVAVPFLYYIADQNYIVAQHIWSKVKNPVTYADKKPVGSGPFVLGSCSPQNITYLKNKSYWQPGRPYVDKVLYPAFMDNQPGNLYLAEGKANWGGQYIPNIQAYYISRDPAHRHFWYAPSGDIGLYLNLKVYPLNNLYVRQALSYMIDRAKVSRIGVYGYLPPANQSGVVLPTQSSWYNRTAAARFNYTFNPSKAATLLQKGGFKKVGGVWKGKNGKPLALTIINVAGFTDWVAEVEVIATTLRKEGVDLKVNNLSDTTVVAREQAGQFQLAYGGPSAGPTPYYWLKNLLYSANSAPIGKNASSNFDRWQDRYTDLLLNSFAKTTSTARQHEIINKLQTVMLSKVPYIPLLEGVHWYQYDTSQLTGWPTKSNLYASTAPYDLPDWEVVLINLHLK